MTWSPPVQNLTFILILLELKKRQGRKKSSFIDLPVIETFRFQDENGYEYEI